MATKKQIFAALEGRVSDSSIQKIDDEWRVVGKYCYAVPGTDGIWDLFICNPQRMHDGLGQRKVLHIASRLEKYWRRDGFHELTGEGCTKVQGPSAILENFPVLGINKRRRVSEAHQQRILQLRQAPSSVANASKCR